MTFLWSFIVGAVCLGFGVLIGAVGHATLRKEEAATVLELTDWAQRLRNAASTDVQNAKEGIRAVISEIEKKF
jgi:hypothetical protein